MRGLPASRKDRKSESARALPDATRRADDNAKARRPVRNRHDFAGECLRGTFWKIIGLRLDWSAFARRRIFIRLRTAVSPRANDPSGKTARLRRRSAIA